MGSEMCIRDSTGPSKVYAAVIAAGLLGLFAFGLVNVAERTLIRRPQNAEL